MRPEFFLNKYSFMFRNSWTLYLGLIFCLVYSGCISNNIKSQNTKSTFIKENKNIVLSIVISPDGSTVATGSTNSEIKLWKMPLGAPLQKFSANTSMPRQLVYSPDSSQIFSGGLGGGIAMHNIRQGKLAWAAYHGKDISAVAYSLDGRWVASAAYVKPVHSSSTYSENLRIWQADNGKLVSEKNIKGAVKALAFTTTNELSIVTQVTDTRIESYVTTFIPQLQSLKHTRGINFQKSNVKCIINPTSKTAVIGNREGDVYLWNINQNQAPVKYFKVDGIVTALALSDNKKQLAIGILAHQIDMMPIAELEVWDLDSNLKSKSLPLSNTINSIFFAPDGKILAYSQWKSIHLWDYKESNI